MTADITYELDVPSGDLNFGAANTMTPGEADINDQEAPGAAPALGDVVGVLSSDTSLAITTQACQLLAGPIQFILLNAVRDDSAGTLAPNPNPGPTARARGRLGVYGTDDAYVDSGADLLVAMTSVQTTMTLGVQASNANILNGSVIRLVAEDMLVTAGGGTAALTVTRGFNGTTAVAHVVDPELGKVFIAPAAGGTLAGNGLNAGVEEYPTFLQTLFPGDFPDVRYFGNKIVADSQVTLNFMIFNPGTLATPVSAPDPVYDFEDDRLGYVSITVLNDPTAEAAYSAIYDFCSPLGSTTTLFGDTKANSCLPAGACAAGGALNEPCSAITDVDPPILPRCDTLASTGRVRYENPGGAGGESGACATECTRFFVGYHYSTRDLDVDGYENSFDPCPTVDATAGYDPRTIGFPDDADNDGLNDDPAGDCDADTGSSDNNVDGDMDRIGQLWDNIIDNCPLVFGGSLTSPPPDAQTDSELPSAGTTDAEARPRGGTVSDAMGDICDGGEDEAATCPTNATAACGVLPGVCTNAVDDDLDGLVNDGCPTSGVFAEVGCLNDEDDPDEDPGPSNTASNGTQTDDTVVNDGCPSSRTVANGQWYGAITLTPICFSNTVPTGGAGNDDDDDLDGFCDAATAAVAGIDIGTPADPDDALPGRTPETYAIFYPFVMLSAGATGAVTQVCNDLIDNDGNTLTDLLDSGAGKCRPGTGSAGNPIFLTGAQAGTVADTDGDGYSDETEIHVGTDPLGRCDQGGVGTIPGFPAMSADWPADLADAAGTSRDEIDIADLSAFTVPTFRLNTTPASAGFNRRWDTVAGNSGITNWITASFDVNNVFSFDPPMFGGAVNAYTSTGGPKCSAHKVWGD